MVITPSAVPEASTFGSLGLLLAGLGFAALKARKQMVRTAEARRILHLLDESPLIEWIRQAADPRVRYIPGVGLCSSDMITAIHGEPPVNTVRNA